MNNDAGTISGRLDAVLAYAMEHCGHNTYLTKPGEVTLMEDHKRLQEAYALFEELAPPDVPRKTFVEWCFRAWEKQGEAAEEGG